MVQARVRRPRGGPGGASSGSSPRPCSTSSSAPSPPGSMGLTLQPYWSPGVRIPGPEAKGAIIGFGDVHTRAHVYRAILEGLAYALREGGERDRAPVEGADDRAARVRAAGRRVRRGGPAHGRRLRPADGPAAHATRRRRSGRRSTPRSGWASIPSIETAVAAMTRIAEVRDPDPAAHADVRRAVPRGLPPDVRRRCARSTTRSTGSPATRRRSEPGGRRRLGGGLGAGAGVGCGRRLAPARRRWLGPAPGRRCPGR